MTKTATVTDYTLLPNQSSFAFNDVCDVTRKEVLATDYDYVGGKHKNKHASFSVVRSWSVLDVASLVVHYDTLHEIKHLIVLPDAHWLFPSQPDTFVFSGFYLADIM